jgi:hypothetical protein
MAVLNPRRMPVQHEEFPLARLNGLARDFSVVTEPPCPRQQKSLKTERLAIDSGGELTGKLTVAGDGLVAEAVADMEVSGFAIVALWPRDFLGY